MATVRDASGNSPVPNTANADNHNGDTDTIHRSYPVVVSDTLNLPNGICEALIVGAAGNVKVTYPNDAVDTVFLAAGIWHPMNVKRVWSSVTTATGIVAGY